MGAAWTFGAMPVAGTSCPGKVTSEGCVPELGAGGPPELGAGVGLDLVVENLVAGNFGLFFAGPTGIPPFLTTGSQTVCVGTPSSRSAVVTIAGAGPCGGAATATLSAPEVAGFGLVPNETLVLQFIARDPQNPDGSGVTLSNAIEILVLN